MTPGPRCGWLVRGALVALLVACGSAAEGPVPVPFDRARCARCGMLVSDASFAGELRTEGGEVLFYDDPGCLLLAASERRDVRAVWFHEHGGERWLSAEEVAFVRSEPTPMGYGLAARPRGQGELDRDAALAYAQARDAARRSSSP